jgi:hypothetical protein
MARTKFNVGDKVISKRESDKKGIIVGYCKKTGEYQVRLENGEIHHESSRWLEKFD